mmetsp:Transcript_17654/g.51394  ORF Transcript_17654/g.51394 Transcript_17654/m.51394 type:complete len:134 (-) Transcript_17654:279-680(-)
MAMAPQGKRRAPQREAANAILTPPPEDGTPAMGTRPSRGKVGAEEEGVLAPAKAHTVEVAAGRVRQSKERRHRRRRFAIVRQRTIGTYATSTTARGRLDGGACSHSECRWGACGDGHDRKGVRIRAADSGRQC